MATHETKYSIGDLVYTATEYKVDKDVIKAIKIKGLKNDIEYGFNRVEGGFSFFSYYSDEFNWVSSKSIYEDIESAESAHEVLKAKKEAEKLKESLERKLERKKELLEELEEIEGEE